LLGLIECSIVIVIAKGLKMFPEQSGNIRAKKELFFLRTTKRLFRLEVKSECC
jgi:hypothetical protein